MALIHGFGQRIGNSGTHANRRRLFDAELHRNCVGGLETDAADVTRKPVRVLGHDLDGVGAIRLEDPHRSRGADTVAVQKDMISQVDGIGPVHAASILAAVPGCALASDQSYRETDLAIDYCEDVAPLPLAAAERIAALMREAGLTAKVSSIHVNGWFGNYDKLATTKRLFAERYGMDLQKSNREIVFAGDSPNDAPMFGFFHNSVGVANVRKFDNVLAEKPHYVTTAAAGAGFSELARHLLVAKSRRS